MKQVRVTFKIITESQSLLAMDTGMIRENGVQESLHNILYQGKSEISSLEAGYSNFKTSRKEIV